MAWTSFFQSCPGHSQERWGWECLFSGAQDKWPFSGGLAVPSPGRCRGEWEAAETLHRGFQPPQCAGGHKNPTVGQKQQVNVGCGDYPVPTPGEQQNHLWEKHNFWALPQPLSESTPAFAFSSQQSAMRGWARIWCAKIQCAELAKRAATGRGWGPTAREGSPRNQSTQAC